MYNMNMWPGYPQFIPFPMGQQQPKDKNEAVKILKSMIRELKEDGKKKKEEKKDEHKPKTFTFLETCALLMFLSPFIALGQYKLWQYVGSMLH